tara:strand:- start:79 stop:414 length:336 start_codon:yes stop_codon:yes gene_type:complete
MDKFWTIIAILSGTFSFAFGMAWLIPLGIARNEAMELDEQTDNVRTTFILFDFFLLIMDVIPIFWVITLLMDAPDTMKVTKEKWNEDKMIPICFWTFIGCISLTITSICMI